MLAGSAGFPTALESRPRRRPKPAAAGSNDNRSSRSWILKHLDRPFGQRLDVPARPLHAEARGGRGGVGTHGGEQGGERARLVGVATDLNLKVHGRRRDRAHDPARPPVPTRPVIKRQPPRQQEKGSDQPQHPSRDARSGHDIRGEQSADDHPSPDEIRKHANEHEIPNNGPGISVYLIHESLALVVTV